MKDEQAHSWSRSGHWGRNRLTGVHTHGSMLNPSCTLFVPLLDEASKEMSCFFNNWVRYYDQIPNKSLWKSYCKNKARKLAIEAVWSPGCCLLPSLEALEAHVHKAQASLVKGALWNLTLQPCPVRAAADSHVRLSAEMRESLRFSTPLPWKPIRAGFTAGLSSKAKLRNRAGFSIKLHRLTSCGQECEHTDSSSS